MPPKEKKGKKAGGKDYQERGKGDQKSALNAKKNIQDKKADKKRADKSVNDGVKFLKKAEGQGGHKKKIVLEQAKVCFEQALILVEGHADALYNLAITELELICHDENISEATICTQLARPCDMLSNVIANDTSRRGETTGLSHRMLANVYCRYYKAMIIVNATGASSFEQLVAKIKTHFVTALTILANYPELDSLLFESCQLFHGMLSSYMEDSGSDYSKLVNTSENVTFLRQQLNACLQTPQSSGIDMDVKLLEGAVLVEAIGYFVSFLSDDADTSQQNKMEFLGTQQHAGVKVLMHECLSAALHLHDALISFAPDDPEVQTVAGDLVQSAVELHDSLNALCGDNDHVSDIDQGTTAGTGTRSDTVFRVTDSVDRHILSNNLKLQSWLIKLVNCRCIVTLQDHSANNMLALGDDLKAIAELIDSDKTLQAKPKFVSEILDLVCLSEVGSESGLALLLEKQSRGILPEQYCNDAKHAVVDTFVKPEDTLKTSASLYHQARVIYEAALSIYHTKTCDGYKAKYNDDKEGKLEEEEEGEEEEPNNISAIHYNLLCVLWKLRESDNCCDSSCQNHLRSYLEIEVESACGGEKDSSRSVHVVGDLLQQVVRDVDLKGLSTCAWWPEVLHEFNIQTLDALDTSS